MSAGYLLERLAKCRREPIRVAVVGGGIMACAIAKNIARTPGMSLSLVIARTHERACRSFAYTTKDIPLHVGDPERACDLIEEGRPVWSDDATLPGNVQVIDIIVEASGDVEIGCRAILAGITNEKKVISFSAETDGLLGYYFAQLVRDRHPNALYGFADGDQPGCIVRLYREAQLYGLDVRGLFNCKGFLNVRATPESMADWTAKSCGTSPRMITSFTDGTKLNLEMNVVANVTGFLPKRTGMLDGIKTQLRTAAADVAACLSLSLEPTDHVVGYTLGGDFGGGVFVLCHDRDNFDRDICRHLKVSGGDGPWRMLYRPYHLCSFEVPLSIAEAHLLGYIGTVQTGLHTRTATYAKRDLKEGEILDGSGTEHTYGQLACERGNEELLPISLTSGVKLIRDVKQDEALTFADVAIPDSLTFKLFLEQQLTGTSKTR